MQIYMMLYVMYTLENYGRHGLDRAIIVLFSTGVGKRPHLEDLKKL